MMTDQQILTQYQALLSVLEQRFDQHIYRHRQVTWENVFHRLLQKPEKILALDLMEQSGGEPDVVIFKDYTDVLYFYDCSAESPKGRRSFCYDRVALQSRKEHAPKENVIDFITKNKIELLTEQEYRHLQSIFQFDLKTSSWVLTPERIRQFGGAIFCDHRYGEVFTYHNGAQSYYASRGFRTKLII